MQFKHPEFLYFLFLLIIPILVHLFQLRRFKKEYFSNVRFLQQLNIQSRKSSQIKKWLLLACRCALITALVFAFAQPFSQPFGENNQKELYLVLDNSFSMQAKGKKGELLKRAVQELLESAPENIHFSLLTNTQSYWNTDIKSIQKELQNVDYSAVPFDLESALNQIKSRFNKNPKDIVVITDALNLSLKNLKKNTVFNSIHSYIAKAEQLNNISIDSVFIKQSLDNFYEIGVQISANEAKKQEVSIGLYNKNQLVAKSIFEIKNKQQTFSFSIEKKAFHGFASLEDNSLSFDNRYYFSIANTKKIKTLCIGDASKSAFLSRIYTPDEFEFNITPLSQLNYNQIENQDCLVLNELEEIPMALQTTLKSFVANGGAIAIIPSANSKTENLREFLEKINIQLGTLNSNEKKITKINFGHSLLKNVFEKTVSNFQYPKTKLNYEIQNKLPVVLYYEDQSPFLISYPSGNGLVSFFSSPLNTENSNFQQSPLIVPVFYQLAQSQEIKPVKSEIIGSASPYFIKEKIAKEGLISIQNNIEKFTPFQQKMSQKVKLNFGDLPNKAGNFSIFDNEKWIENISFNYNRKESMLTNNENELLSISNEIASLETVFDSIQASNNDSQIWKWFLIFALLMLITEMAIIRWMK